MKKDSFLLPSVILSLLVHGGVFFVATRGDREGSFVIGEFENRLIPVSLYVQQQTSPVDAVPLSEPKHVADVSEQPFSQENISEVFHDEQGGGKSAEPYLALLREKIIKAKQYPRRARVLQVSGMTTIAFSVRFDGTVEKIRVVNSSMHPVLDRESCWAVERASPFPPIPTSLQTDQLNISLILKYEL